MAPLRVAVLNAMAERRQLTSTIPGTSLLIQAWKETEDGSGLRKMLIDWTAEHSTILDPFHLPPSARIETRHIASAEHAVPNQALFQCIADHIDSARQSHDSHRLCKVPPPRNTLRACHRHE
jgi:hypothetical protein